MTVWIILGVYAAGVVIAARRAAIWFGTQAASDAGDLLEGRIMGFITGLFWPLVLVVAAVTGKLPKTDRQIRADLEARDERIRELERELGMRP